MSKIESRISDTFEELAPEGDSVYKLDNGQVWQQTKYFYQYKYAYRPRVTIEASGSRGIIHVEGFDRDSCGAAEVSSAGEVSVLVGNGRDFVLIS